MDTFKKILLTLLFLTGEKALLIAGDGKGWTAASEPTKSFIENKGQFKLASETSAEGSSVKFAFDGGSTMIYFTSTGISYSFLKRWREGKSEDPEEMENEKKREEKELREGRKNHLDIEAEERRMEFKTDVISMQWLGANQNAQLLAENVTNDLHTYSFENKNGSTSAIGNIKGYKKLIYKNLYPNIDVEYTFHPETGIEYTFILHPGADASLIKMKYSGDVHIGSDMNVHIETAFGDIIDHAPLSFYTKDAASVISSRFIKKGKVVSFELGAYDHTQPLTIDPWTVTPTGLNNTNCAWECEKDGSGNVYIIGGDVPMKLKKYSSAGALQWTYNTPYDTSNGDWLGTLATDLAGNSYVTNGAKARLLKVNTSGGLVYSVTGGALDEYWNIAFNCDQTKLIVGGTRLGGLTPPANCFGMIFDINTATGAVLATKKVGYQRSVTYTIPFIGTTTVSDINEVRSITSSRNSRYYFLTLDSIGAIDQDFSTCPGASTIFNINSTYDFGYKAENFRQEKGNSGLCAIRANGNFVYSQNGTTVHKRSTITGAIIASAAIPGGISATTSGSTPTIHQVGNSGIDIDSCGNVYVGSSNAVLKFDANLNLLSSVATTFKVFDVAVSYSGNVIVCGGTGYDTTTVRTGAVQQINMAACNPMTLICCNTNVCAAGPFCVSDAPVTLSPDQAGGTWSGPGVNASTGVFSPSVAGAGTHTINYTLACGSGSITITVSPCAALSLCQETNGTLSVSNGVGPYNWEKYMPAASTPITTAAQCTACGYSWTFGTCLNGFTPVTTCNTAAYWANFATGTNSGTLPGTYPIRVTDVNGSVVTIADASAYAALPSCSASCPPLTITPASQVNVNCFGQSTGSFSASTSGGASPYDYTLMTGATTVAGFTNVAGSQSFTPLPAGTYTLNVLDNNGCPGSTTITITQPASAVAVSISGTTAASCGTNNGSTTATASGGTSPYDYVWTGASGTLQTTNNITGANTLNGLAAGTYTVTITDNNNCTTSATATITSNGGATVSITSQTNVMCFNGTTGSATATAASGSSPYDYVWTGSAGTLQTTNNISTPDVLNGLAAGTYTVTVTDNTGCTSTATVTITQPATAASVAVTSTTNTPCGASTGSITALASGGSSPYDYVWTGSAGTLQTTNNITTSDVLNNLAAGTYTVNITDNNGCTSSATATVTSTGGATVSITAQTNVLCFGGTTGSATATASGGTSPYDYVWVSASGTIQTTNNIAGADVINTLAAGTYTVTVTDNGGCVSNTNVTITQPSSATSVSITGTTPAACGSSNGSATAQASGGAGPYDYVWSNGAGTLQTTNNVAGSDILNNIAAGTYTVSVTDNNGCASSVTATVINSGGATTTITAQTNVLCFGSATGNATANTTGGSSPYDYVWTGTSGVLQTTNNISVPNTLNGIGAGTYTVTVTDNGGCVSSQTVTITQPASALNATVGTSSGTTCGFNNGSSSVTASGGTGGYLYNWAPAGGSGASSSTLASGSYTVTVTDANGCTATGTGTIASSTGITAAISSQTNILCNGASTGSATVTPSGGTGTYTYAWSSGGGTAATATGLSAGTYTVTVTNGACSNTASVTITQPSSIALTVSTTATSCTATSGTATANASGGTGSLSYLWNNGAVTSSVSGLSQGPVSITVTDGQGCTQTATGNIGITGSITANAGSDINILGGQSATLNASGGTTYLWSPSTGLSCTACPSPVATPLFTTQYCVTATSIGGCTDSDCMIVNVDIICGELFVPTAFSPNNDEENDVLYVMGNCITQLNFAVFDRWGEKVFETTNPAEGWDGKLRGKKLDTGVFVYYLTATVDGVEVKKHGNITLLK